MSKIIKVIIFSGLLVLGLGLPAFAATIPVNCQAKELRYNNNEEQIEAVGDVKITYKEVVIEADTVTVDQKQNIVFANGHVTVTKDKRVYKGNRFIYNIKTGQGWMNPLTTEIADQDIQGPIYFKAKDTLIEGENIYLLNSTFTGCNLDKPHYQLSAGRIEYYPEERVVFYNVWYWEHGIRLLYLPYMVISLKERDKNTIIQPGWSESTGFFLYLQYSYFMTSNNFGVLKANFTEKLGHDYGLEHTTKFGENTRLTQAYQLWDKKITYIDGTVYNYDKFDYSYKYRFQNKFGEKLSLDTWYQDAKRYYYANQVETSYSEKSYEFDLLGYNPFPSFTSNYTESRSYDLTYTQRLNLASRWYVSIGSLLDLSLDGTYVKNIVKDVPHYNFNYGVSASKSWSWASLSANYRETKSDSYYITNLKPDVTLTFPNIPIPLLGSFGLKTQYTNKETFIPNPVANTNPVQYGEPTRDEGQRIAADLTKTVNLAKFGSLGFNFNNLDQYRHTKVNVALPKDVFATTNGLSLVEQFTENFSTELSYSYTNKFGNEESYFGDSFYAGSNIDNYWRWQSEKFQANLSSGYAVDTSYIKPINFNANWNPSLKEQISMSTVYNIEQTNQTYPVPSGFGQSNLRINYNPNDNWRVSLSLGYNPQYTLQPWTDRQFEAEVHDKLGEILRYELAGRYDFFYGTFGMATTRLFLDLHCRELMVGYDWVNNSYQLQLIFKSFPQLPLSLTPNAVGIMSL